LILLIQAGLAGTTPIRLRLCAPAQNEPVLAYDNASSQSYLRLVSPAPSPLASAQKRLLRPRAKRFFRHEPAVLRLRRTDSRRRRALLLVLPRPPAFTRLLRRKPGRRARPRSIPVCELRGRGREAPCSPSPARHERAGALITVCSACHARLHRLASIHVWIPELLAVLWAEQHPATPVQLQLAFGMEA
jgi:hypothetical protein